MISPRLFAVPLIALALGGCDIFDEFEDPTPVAISLTSIEVQGLPVSPNRTTEWDDDGTGPDIFFEIQNTAGQSLYRSDIVDDVDLSQPLAVPVGDRFESPSGTARLFVIVFDSDGDVFSAETIGSSVSFSAEELLTTEGGLTLISSRAENGRTSTYTLAR